MFAPRVEPPPVAAPPERVVPSRAPEPPPAPVVWSYDLVPPEESGIPPAPGEGENAYGDLLSDMGVADDPFAADLVWQGWFDMEASSGDRVEARAMFFDYMGWDEYEFDWDAWRDWYESTSG